MVNKVYSLKDAIDRFVEDGDRLSLGGFTTNKKPYAAVHEILRQGKKDFVAEAGPAGGDWDLLIGEGRVKIYINCYTANPRLTNVSRRFRDAIQKGKLIFEDYSQDASVLMAHAAALGLPFLPVRLMNGSSLTDKWGISKEMRQTLDKVPKDKFVYMDNPFNPGEKVIALPVPQIDTAIVHVHQASPDGTARILGSEFNDIDIAMAAKKTIITCEELISNEEIRREPAINSIPGFCVDAVVHAPYGAHPSQCYDYYDYDIPYFKEYDVASKTDKGFKNFVNKYVYGVSSHEEYLEAIGVNRLSRLKVTPGYGFSVDLSREDVK